MINPWYKIFEHDFRKAYEIANENYLQSSDDFQLRARATASLLLQNYEDALNDFLLLNSIEKNSNRLSDGTYMQIGLCYYALKDIENGITYFKYPITKPKDIAYTSDYSVPPCVLLFIGLKSGKQDIIKIATKRLQKLKTSAPSYLTGALSETELDNEYRRESNTTLRNRRECKVEFYKAVFYLQNGTRKQYEKDIKNCIEITGKYLEFEYYIAKVERDIYLNGNDKKSFWKRIFNIPYR
jgi:tetratricopeptide (TPR) repeat protein